MNASFIKNGSSHQYSRMLYDGKQMAHLSATYIHTVNHSLYGPKIDLLVLVMNAGFAFFSFYFLKNHTSHATLFSNNRQSEKVSAADRSGKGQKMFEEKKYLLSSPRSPLGMNFFFYFRPDVLARPLNKGGAGGFISNGTHRRTDAVGRFLEVILSSIPLPPLKTFPYTDTIWNQPW